MFHCKLHKQDKSSEVEKQSRLWQPQIKQYTASNEGIDTSTIKVNLYEYVMSDIHYQVDGFLDHQIVALLSLLCTRTQPDLEVTRDLCVKVKYLVVLLLILYHIGNGQKTYKGDADSTWGVVWYGEWVVSLYVYNSLYFTGEKKETVYIKIAVY